VNDRPEVRPSGSPVVGARPARLQELRAGDGVFLAGALARVVCHVDSSTCADGPHWFEHLRSIGCRMLVDDPRYGLMSVRELDEDYSLLDVLLIGLWVDDPPDALPNRFAHLPAMCRQHGVRLHTIHQRDLDSERWLRAPPAGLIISGSKRNLGEDAEVGCSLPITRLLTALPALPVLGICFGHQFLAYAGGGRLGRLAAYRQDADHAVRLGDDPLFAGLPRPCPLPENHGQVVVDPGPDYRVIADSADGIEAIRHRALPRWGVQFHPEYWPRQRVPHGERVVANWLGRL
jgi:GMP synthase-like glutamine amidotransferase